MNSHKAQGLPITTVILAALGLVVLLILFGILTGKLQWFGKGLTTCPGGCMSSADCENVAKGYDLGTNYNSPEGVKDCGGIGYTCCSNKKAVTNAFSGVPGVSA